MTARSKGVGDDVGKKNAGFPVFPVVFWGAPSPVGFLERLCRKSKESRESEPTSKHLLVQGPRKTYIQGL